MESHFLHWFLSAILTAQKILCSINLMKSQKKHTGVCYTHAVSFQNTD